MLCDRMSTVHHICRCPTGQDFTAWVELKALDSVLSRKLMRSARPANEAAFPDEGWSIATGPDAPRLVAAAAPLTPKVVSSEAAKVFLVPVSAEDEEMAPKGGHLAPGDMVLPALASLKLLASTHGGIGKSVYAAT